MAQVEETVIIKAKVEGEGDVQKLAKAVNDSKDATEKQTKASEDLAKQNKKTAKDGKKGFNGLKGAVDGVGKGFNILGGAMKAAGIGLIVGLVVKLSEAFSQNQQIMDGVNKIFTTINIVFQAVTNAVVNAFNAASQATGGFDALGKVMSGLLTLALTPIKVSFFAMKLALQQAQLAWEQSFLGDDDPETVKRLNEEIAQTKKELVEVGVDAVNAGKDIVNNFSEAVGEVSTFTTTAIKNISQVSIQASIDSADALVEARKQAQINEALLEKSIFQSQLLAERQRQIRDDETKSFADRIEANEKLAEILQEQQQQELALAQQRLNTAQLEAKANGDNVEGKVAIINAQKEILDIQERIAGFESEQQLNRNALALEQQENLKELGLLGLSESEKRIQELQNEFEERKKLIERTIEDEEERNEFILKARKELNDGISALNKVEEKGNKELEEKKKQNTLDGISAVAQAVGLGKEFSIASALINTYEGITSALKLPFPANILASVATGITGFKAVQDIVSTPVPSAPSGGGGASAGGGASTPSAPTPPAFNLVGNSNTSAITQPLIENEQNPIEAFVVSKNVTTGQQADRNAERASSF